MMMLNYWTAQVGSRRGSDQQPGALNIAFARSTLLPLFFHMTRIASQGSREYGGYEYSYVFVCTPYGVFVCIIRLRISLLYGLEGIRSSQTSRTKTQKKGGAGKGHSHPCQLQGDGSSQTYPGTDWGATGRWLALAGVGWR